MPLIFIGHGTSFACSFEIREALSQNTLPIKDARSVASAVAEMYLDTFGTGLKELMLL